MQQHQNGKQVLLRRCCMKSRFNLAELQVETEWTGTSSTCWLYYRIRSRLVGCSSDPFYRLNGEGSEQSEDGCRGEEGRVIVASTNGKKDRGNGRCQRLRERVGDV